jgi:hypothetical protein
MQHSIKVSSEVQHARGIGLGVLGLKVQFPFCPVDLTPLKRTDVAHSHAAVVGKTCCDLSIIRQSPSEREKVFVLEET